MNVQFGCSSNGWNTVFLKDTDENWEKTSYEQCWLPINSYVYNLAFEQKIYLSIVLNSISLVMLLLGLIVFLSYRLVTFDKKFFTNTCEKIYIHTFTFQENLMRIDIKCIKICSLHCSWNQSLNWSMINRLIWRQWNYIWTSQQIKIQMNQ